MDFSKFLKSVVVYSLEIAVYLWNAARFACYSRIDLLMTTHLMYLS